jgi:hypothetical protein
MMCGTDERREKCIYRALMGKPGTRDSLKGTGFKKG